MPSNIEPRKGRGHGCSLRPRRGLLLAALLILCVLPLSAQNEWYMGKPIADFIFVGLDTVTENELLPLVRPYIGTEFSLEVFWEIQESLYALDYFESIEANAEPGDDARESVIIAFTVQEKPTVEEVVLEGNRRLRKGEILENVLIAPGDMVTDIQADLDAQAIMDLAEEAEAILNLHSAGEARYLPHVLFYREEDAEWAASLGFPFAIKRGTPESLAQHILSYLRPGQRTLTLELGGGTVVFPEDVTLSVDLIMAFLGRSGFLEPGDYECEPTPPEMVWMSDARLFVHAPGEGAFYPHAQPGTDFADGEPFGFFVGLDDLHPRPVLAPTTGRLIYLRTRNRVPHGGTLAMFLPRQGKCHEEER